MDTTNSEFNRGIEAALRVCEDGIDTFIGDPADSDYQRGYFNALGEIEKQIRALLNS